MYEHQRVTVEGSTVRIVHRHHVAKPDEFHAFASTEEAEGRAAIIREALTWIGTPFADCQDIKGPNGVVDCAMMLVRVYVDSGRLKPFDPRPYNPREMLHGNEEKFLDWIEVKLGAKRVDEPRIGDVLVYQWGRLYSHGAILINNDEICHAYGHARIVLVSRREEALIKNVSLGVHGTWKRPVRFYDVWSS